ncbi:hypothetical protein POM88_033434 [Heracleum sosnowskyi]|uniref:Uncharacterized protein n=1 Tax=Heracleum sosnowskyi TaxID=360622 RepID=A0AAD8I1I2_9APIA|nr:hypothetical protein POM88_033434 [Heracleum sosnowskyi]
MVFIWKSNMNTRSGGYKNDCNHGSRIDIGFWTLVILQKTGLFVNLCVMNLWAYDQSLSYGFMFTRNDGWSVVNFWTCFRAVSIALLVKVVRWWVTRITQRTRVICTGLENQKDLVDVVFVQYDLMKLIAEKLKSVFSFRAIYFSFENTMLCANLAHKGSLIRMNHYVKVEYLTNASAICGELNVYNIQGPCVVKLVGGNELVVVLAVKMLLKQGEVDVSAGRHEDVDGNSAAAGGGSKSEGIAVTQNVKLDVNLG